MSTFPRALQRDQRMQERIGIDNDPKERRSSKKERPDTSNLLRKILE